MMSELNFKREVALSIDDAVAKLTQGLASEGFGVLTRIDFHTKMKEKLGKDVKPVVILGACNPQLAYEAYLKNTDITSLIPCNAVVREVAPGTVSVELAKPTMMMKMLGEQKLVTLAEEADKRLKSVLEKL